MAREIALSRGLVTLVDDDLSEWLGQWPWHANVGGDGGVYARRSAMFGQKRTVFYMHRIVCGAPNGLLVDHIDGNSLNNCRANLRLATTRQNSINRRSIAGQNRYRGVRAPENGRHRAVVVVHGRQKTVGWASSPEEAARLYDAAAREFHGEFAVLNFPEEPRV